MMDVVDEEVGEQVADALRDFSVLAPIGNDAPVEIGLGQAVAKGDQPPVEFGLRLRQTALDRRSHEAVEHRSPTPPSSIKSR